MGVLVAKPPAQLQQISAGASSAFETMSAWSGFFDSLGKVAGPVLRGIVRAFKFVGTAIGENIARVVLLVEKLVSRLKEVFRWIRDVSSSVKGALDSVNPFSDGEAKAAPSKRCLMDSPSERTARILEERRTLNTTEVILRDSTGKAQVVRGGDMPGFKMMTTGGF